jgi:phosphohistidine phosphatase
MAKLLKSFSVKPDLIISSTTKRALMTAKAFAEEFGYKKGEIKATEELYHADENDMLEIIKNADDSCITILMFGHNPELTYFAHSICDYNIDNIPTCGVFCIDFKVNSWSEVGFGKGKFISFEYPKKYFQ